MDEQFLVYKKGNQWDPDSRSVYEFHVVTGKIAEAILTV